MIIFTYYWINRFKNQHTNILTNGDKGLEILYQNLEILYQIEKYLWRSLFFNLGSSLFLPLPLFPCWHHPRWACLRTSRKASVVWRSTEGGSTRWDGQVGREGSMPGPGGLSQTFISIWRTKGTAWRDLGSERMMYFTFYTDHAA